MDPSPSLGDERELGIWMLVTSHLLRDLYDCAAASSDREICGLLFGTGERIVEAQPTANVAHDAATAFEIDPQALFAALRAERAGRARVIGCYHSHPFGNATPSTRDAAAAEAGRLWLILARGEARLWRAKAGGFDEVALRLV